MKPGNENDNSFLWRYASMGTQLLVSIGAGVFIGLKIDKWLKFKIPLLVWILPLLIIIIIIIRLIKDTSGKNE